MGSISSFLVSHLCMKIHACHIYHALFRVRGGRGLFDIFSVASKNILLCWETVRKDFLKTKYSHKMYITMKYRKLLQERKQSCVFPAINHPSRPVSSMV